MFVRSLPASQTIWTGGPNYLVLPELAPLEAIRPPMTNPKFGKAISASSLSVIPKMRPDKWGPAVSLPAFEPMGGMVEMSRFADIVSSDENLKLFGAFTNFAAPATAMELSLWTATSSVRVRLRSELSPDSPTHLCHKSGDLALAERARRGSTDSKRGRAGSQRPKLRQGSACDFCRR
ncbi:hypothetical protein EHS25_000878 [Saitozyma podzolica]|uniref:Uncharacterized protein n=1 Tax=Saitozyma podzolica TaxID=1890683 RepID=A0A427YXH8_9TREE|nr:hypothetical protein EHS25_000878 [Saitozyma podzolica]